MSLLEVKNIDTFYGKFQALYDVSLTVDPGEIAILIGQNGTGKTTTMKSIMGIQKPSSGQVSFDGRRITSLDPHQTSQAGIAFVPGSREVFPNLTVKENLRLGYIAHDSEPYEDRIDRMFDFFPVLEERQDAKSSHLSGGEQQMLVIARALMSDPELLLLDEPVEGLMPSIVEELKGIIAKINSDGVAMVVVEHNLEFAFDVGDYTYIISRGKIKASGPSNEVREDEELKSNYLAV